MTAAQKQPSTHSIPSHVIEAHGLTMEEYARVEEILGRAPNLVELGIFSVMWSEHCSYKTTRMHLSKFPTTGPQVICGPGENAGVVDIGDGQAVIFQNGVSQPIRASLSPSKGQRPASAAFCAMCLRWVRGP